MVDFETPRSAYLVCATPRSGSTLLCELLRATGVAGRPLEHFEVLRHSGEPRQPREHFDGLDDPGVLSLLAPTGGFPDPEPSAAWWHRIVAAGTGPNGVWGGKLMWGHTEDFLLRARELDGLGDAGLATVLRTLLGDVRLVLVTRPDKVAQAVSLWRAVQTQRWRHEVDHEPDAAEYRFAGIDHLRRRLEADDAAWRTWLADWDAPVHEVSYDALSAAPHDVTAAVLRALGLPDDGVPDPPLKRQGDERSAAWRERYRAELAARTGTTRQ